LTAAGAGHRIRLRGPWNYAWIDAAGHIGAAETRKHPDDWATFIGDRSGRVRLTRTFHAPTNLDETEQVFVVLTGVHGAGTVLLNGQSLGDIPPHQNACEFAVPLPLPFSNELTIDVSFAAAAPTGLYDVVTLEIRRSERQ
jgi:hypothetical protein